jgi:hypothetical protein
MDRDNGRPGLFLPAVLLLGVIGFWSPWLAHRGAALQLNGYELSEWVTFLPAVQAGELPLNRLSYLIVSACLAVLLALAANRDRRGRRTGRGWWDLVLPGSGLGWALLIVAALSALAVFPYYPYFLTAYADPEFQVQFWTACATVVVLAIALWLPEELRDGLQVFVAAAGVVACAWSLWTLWPAAAALLGQGAAPGWGWILALLCLAVTAGHGWRGLFQPRR